MAKENELKELEARRDELMAVINDQDNWNSNSNTAYEELQSVNRTIEALKEEPAVKREAARAAKREAVNEDVAVS